MNYLLGWIDVDVDVNFLDNVLCICMSYVIQVIRVIIAVIAVGQTRAD